MMMIHSMMSCLTNSGPQEGSRSAGGGKRVSRVINLMETLLDDGGAVCSLKKKNYKVTAAHVFFFFSVSFALIFSPVYFFVK